MKNNDASSTLTAKVKLIAKNTFIDSKTDTFAHHVYVFQTNLLTFELENLRRIVLEVSPYIFASLLENDVGILTYTENGQSAVFVNFQQQLTPSQATP